MTDVAPAATDTPEAPAPPADLGADLAGLLRLEPTAATLETIWAWLEAYTDLKRPAPVEPAAPSPAADAGAGAPAGDATTASRLSKLEEGLGAILHHLGIPTPQ
jgi:hypothetical protein